MQTLALIGRRILYAALLLLAVIVLNFTLIRLAPGDIVQTIAGQMGGMNEELMLELRHSFQLDKSIPEQLLIYIGKVAHGDLGYSYFFNQPVLDLILGRVGPTVLLVFSSLVLSVVAGTLLGTLAEVMPTPANDVYVVKSEDGQEHLIPSVPDFVLERNLDEGYIRVRLIEGM